MSVPMWTQFWQILTKIGPDSTKHFLLPTSRKVGNVTFYIKSYAELFKLFVLNKTTSFITKEIKWTENGEISSLLFLMKDVFFAFFFFCTKNSTSENEQEMRSGKWKVFWGNGQRLSKWYNKKRQMQIENINRENNSSRRTNFWIFNTTGVD